MLFSPENIARYAESIPEEQRIEIPRENKDDALYRIAQSMLIGGTVGDLLTTKLALNKGGQEANPMFGSNPSFGRIALQKTAMTAPALIAMHMLHKNHPRVANILGMISGAMPIGASIYNMKEMNK